MPDVKPGESQSEYMKRCVPMVKDEGATQDQAVGKCLGMYRHATESKVIKQIDKILEAVVVGTVGKEMEQKLCPRNQVWCPKCNACVDRQERTGMGVPVPENFECPDCKKDKVEFAWENTNTPVNVDLSNVTLFFLEAENNAKWKKLNVKDLTQLQKKTHSKMNPRLTHSLKLQVEKMNVKRLWFYVDPYSDYIYNKRELSWAWEKREADQEVQSGWDAVAEKEPWGEKSFGRLKTL
jgi:hypothetical protein